MSVVAPLIVGVAMVVIWEIGCRVWHAASARRRDRRDDGLRFPVPQGAPLTCGPPILMVTSSPAFS